jgi:peptidoglycan/LPS O-acetylase OafA/YrhL
LGMIGVGMALAYVAAFLTARLLLRLRFPLPQSAERIGHIDGLRGLLALSVMMHHFVIWMQVTRLGGRWEQPTVLFLENLGSGSVSIFFMVTGFLFHRNTLRGFSISRLGTLWVGRFFRLTPLVVFSVVVICVIIISTKDYSIRPETVFAPLLTWVVAGGEPPLLGHADSSRINAHVLWSLKYEWMYYLLGIPLIALAHDVVRGKLPTWAPPLALLVVSVPIRIVSHLDLFAIVPLFAIGMLANEVSRFDRARILFASPSGMVVAVACLIVALACAPEPYGTPWEGLLGIFFASVACGNTVFGLLSRREFLALGECSYGIYLFHGLILFILFFFGAPLLSTFETASLPLLLPFVAIVVVALTATTFLVIEKPGIAFGREVVARISTLAAPFEGRSNRMKHS